MIDFYQPDTEPPLSRSERRQQAAYQIDLLASDGEIVPVDPEIADLMASFIEDALSVGDAVASNLDVDFETGFALSDKGNAS